MCPECGHYKEMMTCYWCRVSLQAAPRFGKLFSKYVALSAHQWSTSLRHHILNDLCLRFFTYRGLSWGNVDTEIANCGLGHNVVIVLLQIGNYPKNPISPNKCTVCKSVHHAWIEQHQMSISTKFTMCRRFFMSVPLVHQPPSWDLGCGHGKAKHKASSSEV